MTWLRLGDEYHNDPVWDGVPFEARWHYGALIGKCCRESRWDGVMPLTHARRASDVPDPDGCHDILEAIGLLELTDGEMREVRVIRIDQYVPPPYVRENSEKSKVRMRRKRAHDRNDHSLCLPENCDHVEVNPNSGEVVTRDVTRNTTGNPTLGEVVTPQVTRNTGTGRDGTGTGNYKNNRQKPLRVTSGVTGDGDDGWPKVRQPGSVGDTELPIPDFEEDE